MNKEKYISKATVLATECAKQLGLEIESVNFLTKQEGWILEILADKEFGLEMDDAVKLNELISAKLDEEDFIEEEYFLEVSSVGAERKLKTDREIEAAIGKYVTVVLIDQTAFTGILDVVNSDTVEIRINQKGRIKRKEIPQNEVEYIHLAIRF